MAEAAKLVEELMQKRENRRNETLVKTVVTELMKMNHEKTWAMATLYDLMALDYSKVSVADEMLAVFRPKSFFPADKPTILTPVSQKNPPLNEWESQIMAWIQLVNDDPSKIVHETLLKEPIPDSFSFHWTARNFLQKRFLETRDANTWIIASKLALERDTKPDKRFYSPISPEWSCVVDLILESQSCSLQVLEQIASSLSFDSNLWFFMAEHHFWIDYACLVLMTRDSAPATRLVEWFYSSSPWIVPMIDQIRNTNSISIHQLKSHHRILSAKLLVCWICTAPSIQQVLPLVSHFQDQDGFFLLYQLQLLLLKVPNHELNPTNVLALQDQLKT